MAYLGNSPARSFISFERQVFTIVNSQTAYTLDHSVTNENDIRLVVNNVVQEPGSGKAYTASGTTLTLSAALTNGTDEMYCVFLGRAVGTVNPPAASVDTAQLAITETKTIVEKVNRGGGIIIDVEKRVTDTIGYEPVAKYFENRDYKNMWQVPGVAGKEFEVEIGTVEKVAGLVVPTFYVKTAKEDILQGLSKSLVKQEKEAIEADQIKGEYVCPLITNSSNDDVQLSPARRSSHESVRRTTCDGLRLS